MLLTHLFWIADNLKNGQFFEHSYASYGKRRKSCTLIVIKVILSYLTSPIFNLLSYQFYYYTTIQRMTIVGFDWQNCGQSLTYWWFSDFSFWKKGQKFFPTPRGFHLKTFPTPYGCQKWLTLPLTGFFYPWRELIFSLKKLFLTPNLLQIGKNGLNWPSFFLCNLTLLSWFG